MNYIKHFTLALLLLTFSCMQEKNIQENIVGKWQTDSIHFNGVTFKGDLLKNNLLWSMEFKSDNTYQIYKGNNAEIFSDGHWNFDNNRIEAIDQVNTKMQCEFISENVIKLTYQKENDFGIMYMSRKDFNTKKEISTKKQNIGDEKAKVSGIATYPSEGIPDYINVYAQDINSKKIYEHKFFDRKQGYFEIYLSDGDYIIFSTDDTSNIKPDLSQTIKIRNGYEIENVNAQDLFQGGFIPLEEYEEEQE